MGQVHHLINRYCPQRRVAVPAEQHRLGAQLPCLPSRAQPLRLGRWAARFTVFGVVALYGALAMLAAAMLVGCGGGDDDDTAQCGQPDDRRHPLDPSCICQKPGACT